MARKRTASVPADESKEQRSVRLALARMPKALKAIKMVGNLATPSYSYTPEQKKMIIDSLKEAVIEVEAKFAEREAATADSGWSFNR